MNEPAATFTSQSGYDVRLCWGPAGLASLGPEAGVVVLVDVLRFTTALDVATAAGALVHPAPWPHDPSRPIPDGAEVADGSGPRGLSLSPASLAGLRSGDRIVLPSANGSHCSGLAAAMGVPVIGGSLRNASRVARCIAAAGHPASVALVGCGERWPDGSLRPAVEDLIGAGAIVDALVLRHGALAASPEALAAAAAFRAASHDLLGALNGSVSGRQLSEKGRQDDIEWAAAFGVSETVPVLGADGAYAAQGG